MIWEERWHPLREEWVIIAGHRQNRPWVGEVIENNEDDTLDYDSKCFLCPNNTRISGKTNDDYEQIFVFDNDHPNAALDAPKNEIPKAKIYQSKPAHGLSRVVCYSPKHNLTLTELGVEEIVNLLKTWGEQYRELAEIDEINHILIFENKGEVVGVSSPHPHCQIYANNFVFKTIQNEVNASKKHFGETGNILFQEIIEAETEEGKRIIAENENAVAFLPYFARYAYEVFVSPKKTHQSIADLNESELLDLAKVLKTVLIKFDNLWKMEFPYVMVLHQAPTDNEDYSYFHFYIQFLPPLRKPNLLKYLGGPEIGGGTFLSDTSPEEKAKELQECSEIHYKNAQH